MSLNGTHSLERTLDYCDKSNDSFLNTTTDCSILNNVSNISTVTTGCRSNIKAMPTIINQPDDQKQVKSHIHFNRLWSVWYGILVTLFQGYLIILGLQKYLGCSLLKTWKNGLPVTELNMQLIFCGLTFLFLPLFLASALFKVGNLANDGIKLSARKGTCSSEQQPIFVEDDGNVSTMKSLWMHGVPISVFIHIITALCLLLPHLLLEAKLIQNQHLPKDNIWKSEIDFILNHNDKLVILSFINTSPYQNDTAVTTNAHENNNNLNINQYEDFFIESHESLKLHPTETYPIHISTYFDDYDEDNDDFLKLETTTPATTSTTTTTATSTTTHSSTTRLVTTPSTTTTKSTLAPTTSTIRTTVPSSTTIKTTIVQILTEEPTLPTTVRSTTIQSTSPKTTLSTSTSPLTTQFVSSPIVTEKMHVHTGRYNKSHGKNRKHHRKNQHQRQHQLIPDIEDTVDDPNLEIKPDKNPFDFDPLDREIHMVDGGFNNHNHNKKKKIKNGGSLGSGKFSSVEQIRPTLRNIDVNEKVKMTTTSTTTITTTTTSSPPKSVNTEAPKIMAKSKGKDSEIHNIAKPSELISTSTVTSNSKIIDIKQKATDDVRRIIKRSINDDDDDESLDSIKNILFMDNDLPSVNEDAYIINEESIGYAAALIGAVPNFTQSNELEGIGGYLQSIFGTDEKFDAKQWFQKSPSLEYLNLALALLVFSVRYPSLFWDSSKAFTMIFSFQMIINSIDILMLHVGTSILFKLQIAGQFMTVQNQPSPLLLNGIVTLALTLLAYVLIIASSMILYLYGHSRLTSKIRDCQMITLKDGDLWSYFSHCASLCFILGISVVKAPIIHDLSVVYRISLDKTIFASTMTSIIHIFLWIVIWLALTAKRQWTFKLPLVETIYQTRAEAVQPLLTSQNGRYNAPKKESAEETIYWPSSPKLKVTFTDDPSTLSDRNLIPDIIEHDGKRAMLTTICNNAGNNIHHSGEADEGEYATLKTTTTTQLQISEYDEVINLQRIHRQQHHNDNGYDDTSEEGKLLECVQDESVTYASTRDLEPPQATSATVYSHERYVVTSEHHMMSPMAPVTVQVHSELHTSTPRFLRRGDSGMPPTVEALTPKSDTNSTESSTSPPERALSESSSGVHSSEENKDEVVIRPKPGIQKIVKTPAVIQEEPYGRITNNHRMISFKDGGSASNTLPHNRSGVGSSNDQQLIIDYSQCNTMPGAHQINRMSVTDSPKQRTTLPNNIRYSTTGNYMRQMPQLKNAGSPYATGLGSGHHTFSSKFIQNEPLPAIPTQSITQSQSQQQFSVPSLSINHHSHPVHHFNTSSASFTGANPYQMVVNELCANNHQAASFPPPPPITNSLQMH